MFVTEPARCLALWSETPRQGQLAFAFRADDATRIDRFNVDGRCEARWVPTIEIRAATSADEVAIWSILEPVIRAGETYALPRDWSRAAAVRYWYAADHQVFVAEHDRTLVGTYFLCANHLGGGAHVANAGYATAESAQGKGVARAMCEHSIDYARSAGFRAMQFNFVIATNTRAIALWRRMGFSVVGTLPDAFAHPMHGDVDAFVMHRRI